MKNIVLLLSIIALFSIGCKTANENTTSIDTPTSGEINMSVDETLQPIAEAQVDIFQHQYPNAKVNIRYRSEAQCIQDLYNDSSKLIFIGRTLKDEEIKAFQKETFNPPQTKICLDAIALIINPKSPDTAFTYAKMLEILRGGNPKYNVVFDNQSSGTVSYILNLTGQTGMPKNAYASKGNLDAVNYVAEHENTIGVIGWCWISDSDDPKTREYLSKVRLLSLTPRENDDKAFYKPYANNLQQRRYPLVREVYVTQRERRNGLSAGFTSFVISDIGQTIMMKAGLLPAYPQDRWIEINSKSIGKVKN